MKTGIIVQARMGSTRLPRKVLMNLEGQPMLVRVLERLKQVIGIDEIIVATTTNEMDDAVELVARTQNVIVYRGSEEDVLSRYYEAAKKENLDIVIRVTGDCPLIDPLVITEILEFFKTNEYDIVSNATVDPQFRTYPRGLDTEIFSFKALEGANIKAVEKSHREHVTIYIYENTEHKYFYKQQQDNSQFRWTVDTIEDFEFVENIYKRLYHGDNRFYQKEILELIQNEPELLKINEMIRQKEVH
ncbi:MAG: acylneuraminate cytidylyltransferase [Firmicutes bacterium HGW-Firmicutes-1]|jgi:spore coat polysaccharide biosynthesis protein SpsF|nr:MAG: acylneuraminate cytidylyltransferase [Firmicutes bacterium HGW-Firmicutes-1]